MDTLTTNRLNSFLKLLKLHRGETQEAYNDVATVYDSFVKVWDQQIAAPALNYYNQLIREKVKPGAFVLDAGAGTGERTLALLAHSEPGRVIALDASEGMLNVARGKISDPRVEFMVGDLNRLPFGDDTFDLVSCSWAIEIMADPRAAVLELIRVIKPGGAVLYAFCSLPGGTVGQTLKHIITKTASKNNPLTHLLTDSERPFHRCERSSLRKFSGGLTTVALVAKCCPVTDDTLPCQLEQLISPQIVTV